MSYYKTAIESLRAEIVADLNVNYIIDYLIQNRVFTAQERDTISLAGSAVGDVTDPLHRERVIERETETFLDLMLEKDNLGAVFDKFVNVLYKDDNYPWLAKSLQQMEDKLERCSGGGDGCDDTVVIENKRLSFLENTPTSSPVKKRSSNFEHFKEIFLDEFTSDVVIIVGQRRFPAHKFMLYTRSEVFKKMFFDKKGCAEKEIVIYDTKEDTFEAMLRYCYTSECNFDDCECSDERTNKAIDVYKLSHKFQIVCLMNECLNTIVAMIECNNLLTICEFALFYEISILLAEIKFFVQTNGEQILTSKVILSCDTAMEVLATVLSFMALPQIHIIDTIRCVREKNRGALDLAPLKGAVNLEKCEMTDIDSLRDLNLFTDGELFDAIRLKYLSLMASNFKI